jgi:release factor glutamine methyltransferase
VISAGTLRRLTHPILLRYWLKRTEHTIVSTRVGGFRLRIHPTVFHPKYFGSSAILGEYIGSLDLAGREFLDMGTGSGIIGLFAARAGARVTAVDVNPRAVQCAVENAAAAGFSVEYWQSDLFSNLQGCAFDVIAWNPPFFPKRVTTATEAALFAGEDYDVLGRFIAEARAYLQPDGVVYVVLSEDLDLAGLTARFEREGFSVRRVAARKWGLWEVMAVFELK